MTIKKKQLNYENIRVEDENVDRIQSNLVSALGRDESVGVGEAVLYQKDGGVHNVRHKVLYGARDKEVTTDVSGAAIGIGRTSNPVASGALVEYSSLFHPFPSKIGEVYKIDPKDKNKLIKADALDSDSYAISLGGVLKIIK